MKLILKRIARTVSVQLLEDEQESQIPAEEGRTEPFALHTEDGEILPCQVSTSMNSTGRFDPVSLTVTFTVDGMKLRVEGDA